MAILEFSVNKEFMKELQKDTGLSTVQLIGEAFSFYKWAVVENSNGRRIVSCEPDGSNDHEVVMPGFVLPQARGPR